MDEVADYGPKMRALTERQRQFVMVRAQNPHLAHWKMAELAGYAGGENICKVVASNLFERKDIVEALYEHAGQRMRANAMLAAGVLIEIASDKEAGNGMRLRAATALLDRVGLGVQTQQSIHVEHTDRTGAELMDRIKELAAKHGLDPEKLLGGQVSRETSPPLLGGGSLELKAESSDD